MNLFFAVLLLANCSHVASSFSAELSKGKICSLTVGSKIQDLKHLDRSATAEKVMLEGEYYLKYAFKLEGCGVVKALLEGDNATVYRLETTSTDLFTKEGAHVGMSLDKLRSIYPGGKLAFQWDGPGDALYSFIHPQLDGVFVFDASGIINECGSKHPNCEEYMSELRAVSFFTFRIDGVRVN